MALSRTRLTLLLLSLGQGHAMVQAADPGAAYQIRLLGTSPPKLAVHATLPSDAATLSMATSRPGDVPELGDAGWPALVKNLKVVDAAGETVGTTNAGAGGFTLARSVSGPLTLDYEIDYAPLAARGWPAPRECAFADADHLVVIGRSIFVTTSKQGASEVKFSLPSGWRTVVPWSGPVATPDDLTENLVAFTRAPPDVLTAGGFRLQVVTLGHWQPVRAEVRRVLGGAVKRLVDFIGSSDRADYLVVLLPPMEDGGESFRASFALTLDAAPSKANIEDWGNTIAHEVFHHWNGWLLKGADYKATQWFQEGFTEYAANLALVSAGLTTPDQFDSKLASHVTNYRKLQTPLDAPGTHKGPPLYGGGALVAFTWDTMIREKAASARGLGDVMKALLRDTSVGKRRYAWPDIQVALEGVAPGDWSEFHRRYISGTEPLPLADAFARVGLRLTETDGSARVESDPAATEAAKERRRLLMGRTR